MEYLSLVKGGTSLICEMQLLLFNTSIGVILTKSNWDNCDNNFKIDTILPVSQLDG